MNPSAAAAPGQGSGLESTAMPPFATLAQTARNTAQRTLTAELGTLPATLVRFLYGLPFAGLWLALLYCWPDQPPARLPTPRMTR